MKFVNFDFYRNLNQQADESIFVT